MAKREKDIITFRVDSEKREALDAIASLMRRDRSFIINEAIERYLDLYKWQVEQIEKGIHAADTGEFATDEEMKTFFSKWTNDL